MSTSTDFTVFYYVCGTSDEPTRARIAPDSCIEDLRCLVAADFPKGNSKFTLYKIFHHLTDAQQVEKHWLSEDNENLARKVSQLFDQHKPIQLHRVDTIKEAFGDASVTHYVIGKVAVNTSVSHGNDGRFDDVVPTQDSEATDVLTSLTTPYMSDEGTLTSDFSQDREKVAALARRNYMSPSEGAKHKNVMKVQKKANKHAIYNGRPPALLGPPIVIGHPVFSLFKSVLSASLADKPLRSTELDVASDFRKLSLEVYDNDHERRKMIAKILTFAGKTAFKTSEVTPDRRAFRPDGLVEIRLSPGQGALLGVICFQELKNEIGEGGSDPIRQAELDYKHLVSSKDYAAVRRVSCCPAILIAVAGPNIFVYGAVYMGSRFITECLASHHIAQHPLTSDTSEISQLARIFRAVEESCTKLQDYYTNLDFHSQDGTRCWRPHFDRFIAEDGSEVQLYYTGQLSVGRASKWLYQAIVVGQPQAVVVKFTSNYCAEAHRLLEQNGLAPTLRFCKRVPEVGNLYVVIMDIFWDLPGAVSEAAIGELRRAIDILHDNGFVHGDLRRPNVLIQNDQVKLIDFDWSGKEGEVKYPETMSMEHGWHPDVRRCGPIEKVHDEYMHAKIREKVLTERR